jgi:hypothetical protein
VHQRVAEIARDVVGQPVTSGQVIAIVKAVDKERKSRRPRKPVVSLRLRAWRSRSTVAVTG